MAEVRSESLDRAAGPLRPVWIAVAVATILWATPAHAGVEGVLFGRGDSLYTIGPDQKDKPVEVVSLGRPAAEMTSLEADATGAVVLIGFGNAWAFARLTADGTVNKPTAIDCPGTARISPRGDCAVCDEPDGTFSLIPFAPGAKKTPRPPQSKDTAFLDPYGLELAFTDDTGIWALPVRRKAKRRRLAESAPQGGLLISPLGDRAVAAYPSTDDPKSEPTLFTFALNGKGVRRRLNRNGVALAWSRDGTWLLVRDGIRACLVKATGGQYKCWKKYEGATIAPDGAFAVVRRDAEQANGDGAFDLFLAKVAGAYTESPREFLRNTAGVALWLPGPPRPVAPPSLPPPPSDKTDADDDSHGDGNSGSDDGDAEHGD